MNNTETRRSFLTSVSAASVGMLCPLAIGATRAATDGLDRSDLIRVRLVKTNKMRGRSFEMLPYGRTLVDPVSRDVESEFKSLATHRNELICDAILANPGKEVVWWFAWEDVGFSSYHNDPQRSISESSMAEAWHTDVETMRSAKVLARVGGIGCAAVWSESDSDKIYRAKCFVPVVGDILATRDGVVVHDPILARNMKEIDRYLKDWPSLLSR